MIGIFDSGSGGLSVYREINRLLPHQRYLYVSDSAHCPYGEKSRDYIIERASIISEFLLGRGCSVIVVACNTATAAAISTLRATYDVPFIGMEPAVKPAALSTRSGVIGVLATAGTLKAASYLDLREKVPDTLKVVDGVGRGFVELVESGDLSSAHAEDVVRAGIEPLVTAGADVIVLGCTHYPFLRDTIAKVAAELAPDRQFDIIDPAPAVARQLVRVMHAHNLLTDPEYEYALAVEHALTDGLKSMSVTGLSADAQTVGKGTGGEKNIELYASGDLEGLERIYNLIR